MHHRRHDTVRLYFFEGGWKTVKSVLCVGWRVESWCAMEHSGDPGERERRLSNSWASQLPLELCALPFFLFISAPLSWSPSLNGHRQPEKWQRLALISNTQNPSKETCTRPWLLQYVYFQCMHCIKSTRSCWKVYRALPYWKFRLMQWQTDRRRGNREKHKESRKLSQGSTVVKKDNMTIMLWIFNTRKHIGIIHGLGGEKNISITVLIFWSSLCDFERWMRSDSVRKALALNNLMLAASL